MSKKELMCIKGNSKRITQLKQTKQVYSLSEFPVYYKYKVKKVAFFHSMNG